MCGYQPRFIPPSGTVSKTLNVRETLTVKEGSYQTLPEQGGRMGVLSCKAAP